ncbi:hypothetical protein TNIN_256451 [Trichonephila inaurata madagascariensis]|uniref:Uncharacterized protein n=1 Tax=Trichonephila inaurata madagascariensis TaxID=2747483 RepID=A0A8X7BVE2_9ARAC|nr:hypothetical protein TNIN_256451 [Trichonephila inaurata madagascariensis]
MKNTAQRDLSSVALESDSKVVNFVTTGILGAFIPTKIINRNNENFFVFNRAGFLNYRDVVTSWKMSLHKDISDKPREKAVVEFRLAVSHNCLADHLHCIGIFERSNCPLCLRKT